MCNVTNSISGQGFKADSNVRVVETWKHFKEAELQQMMILIHQHAKLMKCCKGSKVIYSNHHLTVRKVAEELSIS